MLHVILKTKILIITKKKKKVDCNKTIKRKEILEADSISICFGDGSVCSQFVNTKNKGYHFDYSKKKKKWICKTLLMFLIK